MDLVKVLFCFPEYCTCKVSFREITTKRDKENKDTDILYCATHYLALEILAHCTKCHLENDTASPVFVITPINTVADLPVALRNERHISDIYCTDTHTHTQCPKKLCLSL